MYKRQVPTVIEKTNQREYAYDIYSRLLEDRIILLTGTIDDKMASSIVGQLLYLELNKSYYYLLVRMDTVAGTNPGEATFNIILPSFRVLFTTTIARPFHAFR